MTEPEVADLARAFAPYAWPVASVVIASLFRRPISRALIRVAERITRLGVRTQAGQVNVDLERVTDEARARSDVLDEIQKKLPPA